MSVVETVLGGDTSSASGAKEEVHGGTALGNHGIMRNARGPRDGSQEKR